jgi:hypothetical protein
LGPTASQLICTARTESEKPGHRAGFFFARIRALQIPVAPGYPGDFCLVEYDATEQTLFKADSRFSDAINPAASCLAGY